MRRITGKPVSSQSEIDYILDIKQSEITKTKLKALFATTQNKPARFNVNDTFKLPAGKLYNDTEIMTTVGKYIFNLFMLYPKIIKFTKYINKPVNKGVVEDIDELLASLLIDDQITAQDQIDYINKINWMGYGPNKFLVQSLSYDIYNPIPSVIKRRDELFDKNKKSLESGNVLTAAKVESELVNLAKKEAHNLVGMELFTSGAAKAFANNYKNASIMRGPIKDNSTGVNYYISKDNLVDGIKKEEFAYYADLPVLGSHSRAVGTREGGYQKKILEASFQTVEVEKGDFDCGSKGYLDYKITGRNSKSIMYRYIIGEDGKLINLTPKNMKSYIGKTVKLRSPQFCISEDKYCPKCAGDIFEKMDIPNAGLLTSRIGTKLLNSSLKSFHDTTIKVTKINLDDYIIEH